MRTPIVLLIVILALATGVARTDSAAATIGAPTAFVRGTFCLDNNPGVIFFLPGTDETAAILAAHGASGSVDAIWIDLSLFDNDFAPGTFLGMGPSVLNPAGAIYREWRDLQHEATHFYRLNARLGESWIELGRGTFRTNNCLVLRDVFCAEDGAVIANFEPLQPGILEHRGLPAETWIDLSLVDNGFAAGTYLHAGPFAPTPSAAGRRNPFLWYGLIPGQTHYYRENTRYSSAGWVSQYAGSFVTPDCDGLPKVLPSGVG